MAHFCLIVVSADIEAIAPAMARFRIEDDEAGRKPHFTFRDAPGGPPDPETGRSGFWHNPDGKWDGCVMGGRWWGLLGPGPWGPEHYDDARNDSANRCTGSQIGERLLTRSERLAEIHALLVVDRWQEATDFPSAQAWQTALRETLGAMSAGHLASVIDCHC
jgi:hypothetical protein